jgi:hypothetical protein
VLSVMYSLGFRVEYSVKCTVQFIVKGLGFSLVSSVMYSLGFRV